MRTRSWGMVLCALSLAACFDVEMSAQTESANVRSEGGIDASTAADDDIVDDEVTQSDITQGEATNQLESSDSDLSEDDHESASDAALESTRTEEAPSSGDATSSPATTADAHTDAQSSLDGSSDASALELDAQSLADAQTSADAGSCDGGTSDACAADSGLSTSPCTIDSDCVADSCWTATCMAGTCVDARSDQGTPCGGEETACRGRDTCDGAGTCVQNYVAADTPVDPVDQVAGDCRTLECNGSGAVVEVVDDTDVPAAPVNECKQSVCSGGSVRQEDVTDGIDCSDGKCFGGTCVECIVDSDCSTTAVCRVAHCSANKCVEDDSQQGTCNDGRYCTTNDSCSAGNCTGTARSCGSGRTCDESANACVDAPTLVEVSSTCDGTSDVMLAAQVAVEKCGADSYTTKPYDDDEGCIKFYCTS